MKNKLTWDLEVVHVAVLVRGSHCTACISGALPSLPEFVLHVAVVLVVVLEQAERP